MNPVYVASSWSNRWLDLVHVELRDAGIPTYDFREHEGFNWTQVFPDWDPEVCNGEMPPHMVTRGLSSEPARRGYDRDLQAMLRCSALLMVMPCGNSAHAEMGHVSGWGRETAILLPLDHSPVRPDLMWKLADRLFTDLGHAVDWLVDLKDRIDYRDPIAP